MDKSLFPLRCSKMEFILYGFQIKMTVNLFTIIYDIVSSMWKIDKPHVKLLDVASILLHNMKTTFGVISVVKNIFI